jgi:hypothetical protein
MMRGTKDVNMFGTRGRKASIALAALLIMGGCTVVQGEKAQSESPAPVAAPVTAAAANDALTTGGIASIASANIPIPLPSPLNRSPVQVASIDPSAGVSALGSAAPSLRDLAGPDMDLGSALAALGVSRLNTPNEVRRALARLRFSEPDGLERGWLTSRAMIAAQDPVFAQGVRDEVRSLGKAQVLELLKTDEDYVLQIRGASSGSAAVAVAIRDEGQRMAALSARLIDTAYQFQKQKWGMTVPLPGQPEPETRAADAGSAIDRARAVLAAMSPVGTAHAFTPSVMNRILTLGAHQVIEGTTATAQAGVRRGATGRCLNWARLNLNQCLAAARFPSEEAWCGGKHAVQDVSNCWAEALPSAPASSN